MRVKVTLVGELSRNHIYAPNFWSGRVVVQRHVSLKILRCRYSRLSMVVLSIICGAKGQVNPHLEEFLEERRDGYITEGTALFYCITE